MLILLVSAYIILAVIMFWMFMWQRTALNVCRASDMPVNLARVMVPYWQVILVYPIWIIKIFILVLILINIKWYIPIIILFTDIGIATKMPIPFSFLLNKMEKRLGNPNTQIMRKESHEENEQMKKNFLEAIRNTRQEFNV